MNAISTMEDKILDFSSHPFPWKAMLRALAKERLIALENIGAPGFDWEVCSVCNSGNRHALFDCKMLRAQVQSLADCGIIWIERKVMHRGDCMATSLCPPRLQEGTSHSAMSVGSRKDWDEYLKEYVCKVPLGIRISAPPTLVVIEEIVKSSLDSEASAPKKE